MEHLLGLLTFGDRLIIAVCLFIAFGLWWGWK